MKGRVSEAFRERFGESPSFVVRSPGRVNLIGEHTDYNDGFVLPMAIDRAVWLALGRRNDGRVLAYSLDQAEPADFDVSDIVRTGESWAEYVKGMAKMLAQAGHALSGWHGVLGSDLPIGAGLSSSAALEMAVGAAFAAISNSPFDGREMARAGQRAENEWVGAKTGIMDQMIAANGEAGFAMLIDCRSLAMEALPLPNDVAVLVMDTMTRHTHTSSGYNDRRRSCEQAVEKFGVPALRDLTIEELQAGRGRLDETTFRRARHVVTENARVVETGAAMHAGDAGRIGRLMNKSHYSLRDDFEVSTAELDVMSELARNQHGCFGARMTGGGFGGCAVALVDRDLADRIKASVDDGYRAATGQAASLFVTPASRGTALV